MTPDFEPSALYTLDRLLEGYDPQDPIAFTRTLDFGMYRAFVDAKGTTQPIWPAALDFAKHDVFVAKHLYDHISAARPMLVGVMGGHSVDRGEPVYAAIARLCRRLARRGLVIVTGGGPGAMEAAHLGAAAAQVDDEGLLDEALKRLSQHPELPHVTVYDASTGIDRRAAVELQEWFAAALDVRLSLFGDDIGKSIAIPTWLYGDEPINPFATHYAKFFDNSIREHSLVNRAKTGIVYAPGGGGTLREVFEDLEENYYAKKVDDSTPMVFFDFDGCWTRNAPPRKAEQPHIQIREVITQAMRNGRYRQGDVDGFLARILYTDDEAAIESLLMSRRDATRDLLRRTLSGSLPAIRRR